MPLDGPGSKKTAKTNPAKEPFPPSKKPEQIRRLNRHGVYSRPQSSVNMKKYKAGVLFGEELEALYNDAKDNNFALPAVNTIGTNTINAVLETAAKVNSPVIIQFSNGGAQFMAGKGMPNDKLQ